MSSGTDAIANAGLGIIHSAAASEIKKAFASTGALIDKLINGSDDDTATPADVKAARKQALKDLKADAAKVAALVSKLESGASPKIAAIKTAVDTMGTALSQGGVLNGAKAAVYFADIVNQAGAIIDAVADAAQPVTATTEPDKTKQQQIHDAIANIDAPIVGPLRELGKDASAAALAAFNLICKDALGIDDAGKKLATAAALKWDRKAHRLSSWIGKKKEDSPPATKPASAPAETHGAVGLLNFDDANLEIFLDLGASPPRFGIKLESYLKVGLRGDPLLKSLIPGEADAADKSHVAIELNSEDGLKLGEGKEERIVLPVRLALAGIELRELALGKADSKLPKVDWLDQTSVVAAKFGDALGMVAEGGGVRLVSANGGAFAPQFKFPDGLGFAVNAGPVTGGGYLVHREVEQDFGGVVDLKIGPTGVTAAAIIAPTPFSFVAVMGVHFSPKIELSFGFTLNGLGGLIALNRTLSIDELAKGLKDGIVSNLLFPDDPIKQAPTIIKQLGTVFPARAGGFAVGPIAELGWGSQSGFVKAKVGVVLALPDPSITILGSAQIVVPPPEAGAAIPKVVDLKLDLMATLSPDELYVRASLGQSKIAGMGVSGDFGMIVRWAGSGDFALSAGGFFPQYGAPPRLKDLRRIALELSPPVKAVTITATAYFALTANSVQFGGAVSVKAKLGPVSGEGEIGLDALFEWSPQIHFIFDVHASFSIKFHGHSIAGASFHGRLEGATPWHLEGKATVSILWWDVDFEPGPWTWGDQPKSDKAKLSALDAVAEALRADAAWGARSGGGQKTVVLRAADAATTLLLEPLSVVSVKQERVPIDTDIQRVGAVDSLEKRLAFDLPGFKRNGVVSKADAFSQIEEEFAPGQFLNLSKDQQMSRPAFEQRPAGVELAAQLGIEAGPAADAALTWETFYPSLQQKGPSGRVPWNLSTIAASVLKSAPVAINKQIADPYGPIVNPAETAGVKDAGLKDVGAVDQVGSVMAQGLTTVEAAGLVAQNAAAGLQVQMVTAGML